MKLNGSTYFYMLIPGDPLSVVLCDRIRHGGDPTMTQIDPPISNLYKTKLEGQQVIINKDSKVVILELNQVFRKAGIIFNWEDKYGWQAFGVNRSILRLVDMTKSKLLINFHSNESKKEYWINYDTLRNFIEKNKCEFKVSKNEYIINIPLVLFKEKPIFSGV